MQATNTLRARRPVAVGCAFVTYDRWAQAEAAMTALNGQALIEGATAPMVVKFADAKVQPDALGQKRTFGGPEPFAAGGNKRTFTGAMGAMGGMGGMGYGMANPYAAAAAMGYDVSSMAAMGYGGMGGMGMMGMRPQGMQVRTSSVCVCLCLHAPRHLPGSRLVVLLRMHHRDMTGEW
jgi:hypothetical protein